MDIKGRLRGQTIWIYERGHNLCIPTIYGTCIPWFPNELYTDIITIHIFSTISHIHRNMVPGIYSTGRSKINIQIACTCRYTIWQQCHSLLKYRYFWGVKVKEGNLSKWILDNIIILYWRFIIAHSFQTHITSTFVLVMKLVEHAKILLKKKKRFIRWDCLWLHREYLSSGIM